ncbi:MAG: hypothetical protein ACREQW_16280 [Candidatus Binatia bacterium]
MEIVKATLWLYQLALRRSFFLIRRNWAVLFAPLAYSVILSVASAVFSRLGFIGGILLLLVADACISSGLYLIENLLKMGKVDANDFVKGWRVYLLEIIQVSFILWIPMTLAAQVLYAAPQWLTHHGVPPHPYLYDLQRRPRTPLSDAAGRFRSLVRQLQFCHRKLD